MGKQYFAVGDFEFTCEENKYTDGYFGMVELLSAGIIVYTSNYTVVKKYYSLAKPKHNTALSDFCKELCGITQEEVDAAPSGVSVVSCVTALLDKYNVRKLYVYGDNDKNALFKSALHYKDRKESQLFMGLSERTKDIRFLFPNSGGLGQVEVMKAWGIEINPNIHNAMTDAENLFLLLKNFNSNPKPDENILLEQSVIKQTGIATNEEYRAIIERLIADSQFSFLEGKHTISVNEEYAQAYLDNYIRLSKHWGNIDMCCSAMPKKEQGQFTVNDIPLTDFEKLYLYKRSNGRAMRATYMLVLVKGDDKYWFASNNPVFKQLYRECFRQFSREE